MHDAACLLRNADPDGQSSEVLTMTHLNKLNHYKVLPQIAGWKTLLVAFAARAPFAMLPLGVLTAVSATTGSVATGGLATGVTALSAAIAGPLIGKWADRRGQQLPLQYLTPVNALALLGLYLSVQFLQPLPLILLFAVITGFSSLPIGSFTRSRWVSSTRMPHELSAALSYESMADELVFVLGPAVVGIVASLFAPVAPLLIAFILTATVGMIFAFSPVPHAVGTESAKEREKTNQEPGVKLLPVLALIVPTIIAMIAIGMLFGGIQSALTARANLLGIGGSAGLIYSAMGIGSAIMAIFTVVIPESLSLPKRLLISGLGTSVMVLLTAYVGGITTTALSLFLIGLFIGPGMVTAFSITEDLAPANGVSIAMTAMQSSVTIGVSFGAALVGIIAQSHGDSIAFVTASLTGIIIAGVGLFLALKKR
ncbi:MFS transporter [Gleimia sp. 6138-11-ORH1]|uniref:MFS transporter n=1 Tax=Gleimia sp. 6138-11-ORH1 TaxID=2973937 RepID=UPI002169D3CD|nr:MFS transporter [Gleimia sp. 6138-11-ORH1]MCS4484263.1 MFS transporter [Gleimia sp. 6138-11-ORH1]